MTATASPENTTRTGTWRAGRPNGRTVPLTGPKKAQAEGATHIYLIRSLHLIKVGRAENVYLRLSNVRTARGRLLHSLAARSSSFWLSANIAEASAARSRASESSGYPERKRGPIAPARRRQSSPSDTGSDYPHIGEFPPDSQEIQWLTTH